MMIFAVGISLAESDLFTGILGKERAGSYWVTTIIRTTCIALACTISAFDIGFVNFLNISGSFLGVSLTFIFPVV